jgi:hypothetical protein
MSQQGVKQNCYRLRLKNVKLLTKFDMQATIDVLSSLINL